MQVSTETISPSTKSRRVAESPNFGGLPPSARAYYCRIGGE
jgi:hypothetical protein